MLLKIAHGSPMSRLIMEDRRACFLSSSVLWGFIPKRPRSRLHAAILDGSISAAMTVFELGKLKRAYLRIWSDVKESALHEGASMKLYVLFYDPRSLSDPYQPLFDLMANHGIHFGDLSSIIAAAEYDKPLLTDDDQHIWRHRQFIEKAVKAAGKKIEIYTSRDVDFLLRRLMDSVRNE